MYTNRLERLAQCQTSNGQSRAVTKLTDVGPGIGPGGWIATSQCAAYRMTAHAGSITGPLPVPKPPYHLVKSGPK